VSRTAPIGPELAGTANALVITVMLPFQEGDETLSPFSDSCLKTSEVPGKYYVVSIQIKWESGICIHVCFTYFTITGRFRK